jgi:hypothetical protein
MEMQWANYEGARAIKLEAISEQKEESRNSATQWRGKRRRWAKRQWAMRRGAVSVE